MDRPEARPEQRGDQGERGVREAGAEGKIEVRDGAVPGQNGGEEV